MTSNYTVARLDHSIRDSAGRPHCTHQFTSHRTIKAAARSALKLQNKYNCIDIIDRDGHSVDWLDEIPQND